MSLDIQNATVNVGSKTLLNDVSLRVEPGQVVTVLGPNGAGKSTLMKVACGERPLSSGKVLLNHRERWDLRQKALMLGVLPQSSSLSFPFTVQEVVMLGRTTLLQQPSGEPVDCRTGTGQGRCLPSEPATVHYPVGRRTPAGTHGQGSGTDLGQE